MAHGCHATTTSTSLLLALEDVDELVVHDEDEGAADGADDVGQVALEEGPGALVGGDLPPAVHGVLVHLLALAGHHHEPPAHGVEGVGRGHGDGGHGLRERELGQEGGRVHHVLGGVVGSEVDGAIEREER